VYKIECGDVVETRETWESAIKVAEYLNHMLDEPARIINKKTGRLVKEV
jgi:hypothetical protein